MGLVGVGGLSWVGLGWLVGGDRVGTSWVSAGIAGVERIAGVAAGDGGIRNAVVRHVWIGHAAGWV